MKINILFYIGLGIFLVSISLILLTVQNKDGFENTNTKSEIIELDKLLEKFSEQKLKIKMEHDRLKLGWPLYGIINHAEVVGFINPSDNNLWDVIIPGYNKQLKEKYFETKHIIGVYKTSDGNSKIFMRVNSDEYDPKRSELDLKAFINELNECPSLTSIQLQLKDLNFFNRLSKGRASFNFERA